MIDDAAKDEVTPEEVYMLVALAPGLAMIWDGPMDGFTPAKNAARLLSLIERGLIDADGKAITAEGVALLGRREERRRIAEQAAARLKGRKR